MPRTTTNLTDTAIKTAKPKKRDDGKLENNKLPDGRGLYLLVTPSGSKIWRFYYPQLLTKKRTEIKLGEYPEMTLSQARAIREEYRALLANGIDPQDHRKQEESKATAFKAICDQWFAEIYPTKATRETIEKNYKRLERFVFPKIGGLPIAEIKPKLLVSLYKEIGASNTLDKIHRLIIGVMNYAIKLDLIEGHNCDIAKEDFNAPLAKNHPSIKPDELPELLAVMNKAFNEGRLEPNTLFAFNLTLLTGLRQKELTGLEWGFIDEIAGVIVVPSQLMKQTRKLKEQPRDHIIPISEQMKRLFVLMKQVNGVSRYLFPRVRNRNQPIGKDTVANALRDNGYKDKLDAHGIRSLFRTYLTQKGVDVVIAELAIAHNQATAKGKLTATYDRYDHFEEIKQAFQMMGDYCEQCGMMFTF